MKKSGHSVIGVVVVTLVLLLAAASILLIVLWANDVHQDRKHVVAVNSPTPVFVGSGQNCDTIQKITSVAPGTILRVRRIRYWKDCAMIDVTLSDHRRGHIVLGIGDVSVKPPLQ